MFLLPPGHWKQANPLPKPSILSCIIYLHMLEYEPSMFTAVTEKLAPLFRGGA